MNHRVISIGALSTNELWPPEAEQPGAAHATTVLVRSGGKNILVDPGLPGRVVTARLAERSGLRPPDIDVVFLTNFRPSHRRGLEAFPDAEWTLFEPEREAVGRALLARFQEEEDEANKRLLQEEINVLRRCTAATDALAPNVDLFPGPGFTPGTCGLLLIKPGRTVLVAGDTVPTQEHLESGRVLRGCYDTAKAQESLVDAIEIADLIVCGHDNVVVSPGR
ncbi:MBL fold metallo-hydrolase [Phycisphaera mikurensis]|uniref:Metallo-beta-lactamase domain-containing protein n=1 Tax=Phycisphaera mikurensis (strain NBRC 102666 / KCTC 22515 / FYK2301M01) TaxID=1142394 RepID=I0IGA1_PHYMF|nr:MBL fold metallo-hydrolase [Phycisphaera mikurensis]MBB6440329.1 glyoxylase-like metal-dependent hydrolase (beta-lactamase superfamily II) [Phycisphaera mikurensis]BAM04289.1 hypothetical protein PSMK_21300 [Phycisphaera mikurensis NBRC 102666]